MGQVLQVLQQHAKAALVTAAVFQRYHHLLTGQRVDGVARQLDVHADRNIVGHHRQVDRITHIAEVVQGFGLVGARVVGRGQH